jgi:HlyD family secretion protein
VKADEVVVARASSFLRDGDRVRPVVPPIKAADAATPSAADAAPR